MRKIAFLAPFAITASLLAACGRHQSPAPAPQPDLVQKTVDQRQADVAADLWRAPLNSLLIYDGSLQLTYGIICARTDRGYVLTGSVGDRGTWRCASPRSSDNMIPISELAKHVTMVVPPTDPNYYAALGELALESVRAKK